jgi:hypothetical protein
MEPHRTNVASPRAAGCDRAGIGHSVKLIDIGMALDLLADAGRQRRAGSVSRSARPEGPCHPAWRRVRHHTPDRIVDHVLALAGVDISSIDPDAGIDTVYFGDGSRVRLTLGAWAVLRAAQQSQDRGADWDEVLAHAGATAIRVLDLVPDSVVQSAAR